MDFWQSLFEENFKSDTKPLFFTKCQHEIEKRINDFYMTVAKKKWQDYSRHWGYLLNHHLVWLEKEINIEDISTEPASKKNTNKNLTNRLLLTIGSLHIKFQENCTLYAFFISVSNAPLHFFQKQIQNIFLAIYSVIFFVPIKTRLRHEQAPVDVTF